MDVSNLFDSRNAGTGSNAGFSGFALSLLVGAWCLTGFEAAADLAEETHTPKKTIPKAIIGSHLAATVFGFLMIAGLILSVSNIELLQESKNPILFVLEQKMGATLIKIIIVIVIVSIFACGLASMATASRLIYSMARDNMLPFSSVLSKVDPKYNTPKNATLLVWALGCIFVLLVRQLVIINSISAVAGYMGYCGILISTLITKKKSVNISGFSLGKWQKPIQGIALLWTATVVAALTIPETQIEGMDETHLPAKSTLVAFLIGLSIYAFIIRRRIKKGTAGPPVN